MCPIGHKRGHIYYIKGGTTKYVPYRAQKRAQKRAHLFYIIHCIQFYRNWVSNLYTKSYL